MFLQQCFGFVLQVKRKWKWRKMSADRQSGWAPRWFWSGSRCEYFVRHSGSKQVSEGSALCKFTFCMTVKIKKYVTKNSLMQVGWALFIIYYNRQTEGNYSFTVDLLIKDIQLCLIASFAGMNRTSHRALFSFSAAQRRRLNKLSLLSNISSSLLLTSKDLTRRSWHTVFPLFS